MRLPLLILTLVLTNLTACSSQLDRSDIVGEYQATYPFGLERLELKADGSYVQSLTLQGQTTSGSHSGVWEYAAPRKFVIVHDPLQFDDHFGKLNPNYLVPVMGQWLLIPTKTFGKVSLDWNDNFGIKLEKVR